MGERSKSSFQNQALLVLTRGAYCGLIGGCAGGVISTFRQRANVPFYIISFGTNFAIIGCTYFALNQTINSFIGTENIEYNYMNHGLSGFVTGSFYMNIFLQGHRKGKAAVAGILLGSAGAFGYYSYKRFERWRVATGRELAIKRKQERIKIAQRGHPNKNDRDS